MHRFVIGLAVVLAAVLAGLGITELADTDQHPPHAARPEAGALGSPLPLSVTGGDQPAEQVASFVAWTEGVARAEWYEGVAAAEEAARQREAAARAVPRSTGGGGGGGPTNWDGVAQCETGGNWSAPGPTYQGGLGIYGGAWVEFGGLEFAPSAGQATREQQIIVAERIKAYNGGSLYGAWGCAAYG